MSPFRLLMFSSLIVVGGCSLGAADGSGPSGAPVLESTPDAVTLPQALAVESAAPPGLQPGSDAIGEQRPYRLVVSFNSFVNGTDPAAGALFWRILYAEQKSLGRTLSSVNHRWGREGEYSYCFMLDELTASEQRAFVEAMRSGLQTDRAYLVENASCPAVFDPMGHRR